MELKFDTTPCRCLRRIMREVKNMEMTQEIRLPDGMPDIGRIIGAWGQVILRSKEWRGGSISASGGVMARVLYAPDDGTEVCCVDAWLPLQGKWDLPDTDREGVIRLMPLLRSADARTVSARKMMVRTGVGILAEALVPYEEGICTPGELPEGVEILKNVYPVKLPREAAEKTFLLDEELPLPASCPPVEKILRFEMRPQILDNKVMAGKMVFRGSGLLHVLYLGHDGQIYSHCFDLPFSQFGDLEEEFGQDACANVSAVVTSLELDVTDDGTLRLKCGIVAQYLVWDLLMLELAEDAYSPGREITPKFRELMLPTVLEDRRERLNCEMNLDAECTRVVDVCFFPDHPRVSRVGGRSEGELSGVFQLLYEDADGALQSAAKHWEQPWSIEGADETVTMLELLADGAVSAVSGAGTVQMKGDIGLFIVTEGERGQWMLCGMEAGEIKEPARDRPSLILRRAEGERLWDIAKSCGTTVQAICQANELQSEPAPGQMLLIPVP